MCRCLYTTATGECSGKRHTNAIPVFFWNQFSDSHLQYFAGWQWVLSRFWVKSLTWPCSISLQHFTCFSTPESTHEWLCNYLLSWNRCVREAQTCTTGDARHLNHQAENLWYKISNSATPGTTVCLLECRVPSVCPQELFFCTLSANCSCCPSKVEH